MKNIKIIYLYILYILYIVKFKFDFLSMSYKTEILTQLKPVFSKRVFLRVFLKNNLQDP